MYGGNPYTPFDLASSVRIEAWNINQQGIPDWDKLNTEQTAFFHQLDVRLDKKYFFKKWLLNIYVDVQNVYNSQINLAPYLDVQRNDAGEPLVDPMNNNSFMPNTIANVVGTVLPTIGIIIEI